MKSLDRIYLCKSELKQDRAGDSDPYVEPAKPLGPEAAVFALVLRDFSIVSFARAQDYPRKLFPELNAC